MTAELFVRRFGPKDAPAIVFLHGGGVSGWMWQEVVDQLPEYACLVPDLPEQGASKAVRPFSMILAAQAVAELIRQQTPAGKATVVGLSEGAQVTVQLLASTPERVEKAIVSSALLQPIPGMSLLTPGLLAWSYRLMVAPLKNSDWWIRLNRKYATGLPEKYAVQFKQSFQETTESGFVNLMLENQRYRLPAGLEKAHAPTLVVVGQKEYAAMKQSARDLAAALPNARAMQFSLGKRSSLAEEHNWAVTAPDAFAKTVRAWLENQPLPELLKSL